MLKYLAIAAVALSFSPDLASAKPKDCPPGLAKKSPACVPPGQAKKGVDAQEWQARRGDDADHDHDDVASGDDHDHDGAHHQHGDWRVGDHVDPDRWVILEEGDRVTIDGREYIVVDTDNGTVLRAEDDWYRLPDPDAGTDWVRVGEDVLRVDAETREIIELIELSRLLLN